MPMQLASAIGAVAPMVADKLRLDEIIRLLGPHFGEPTVIEAYDLVWAERIDARRVRDAAA